MKILFWIDCKFNNIEVIRMKEKKIKLAQNLENDGDNIKETIKGDNLQNNDSNINARKEEKDKENLEQQLDKDKNEYEDEIKKKIEGILKRKIEESKFWSEEQLEQAKNIVENQTKMAVDYIYDKAQKRLGEENETKNENKYFKKLKKKAVEIAENEAQVNPNFDMEVAIKKEQEIKEKVERGKITPEEALKAYSEPIPDIGGGMLGSLSKMGIKTYEDIYKEMTEKENGKNKERAFRDILSKDAPSLEEQALNSKKIQQKFAEIDKSRDAVNDREYN